MNIEIKGHIVDCMSGVKYVGDELEMIMTVSAMYVTNILYRLLLTHKCPKKFISVRRLVQTVARL